MRLSIRASVLALVVLCTTGTSFAQGVKPKFRTVRLPVPEQYGVVLNADAVAENPGGVRLIANMLAEVHAGVILYYYEHALQGFAIRTSAQLAQRLSEDPLVDWVEEDAEVVSATYQNNPPWGLDRIDQRALPQNLHYPYSQTASNVNVYIIDTGLRATHLDFGGRASGVYTSVSDGNGTNDCNGHGTHVAGIAAGSTYGIAKGAMIRAVRVLGCDGRGTGTGVVAGVDWVTQNHVNPAVANMSLESTASDLVDTAVRNSIAAGITYIVAAGNDAGDACLFSPARVTTAITVGATNNTDNVAAFSNQGACVPLFAPGVSVVSDWNASDTATATADGTSMAAPHVTGAAALHLANHAADTPAAVFDAITSQATVNALVGVQAGRPNRLLFTCESPLAECEGRCVDLMITTADCGACGATCRLDNQKCSGGVCVTRCPEGTIDCCVDGTHCRSSCSGVVCP